MNRRAGTNLQHTLNRPDCGWQGSMFIQPTDVNFYNIEGRETDSQCIASGSYSSFAKVWHGNYPPPDRVSPWFVIIDHNTTDGSEGGVVDNIYTGDPGEAATGTAPPFTTGKHHFSIVMQWRTGGAAHNFPAVRQEAEIFAPGQCEARKGGNTESTMYTDPTSTP
jgi:hypothetical protein